MLVGLRTCKAVAPTANHKSRCSPLVQEGDVNNQRKLQVCQRVFILNPVPSVWSPLTDMSAKAKEREVRHGGVQDEGESSRVRCGKKRACVEEERKGECGDREEHLFRCGCRDCLVNSPVGWFHSSACDILRSMLFGCYLCNLSITDAEERLPSRYLSHYA